MCSGYVCAVYVCMYGVHVGVVCEYVCMCGECVCVSLYGVHVCVVCEYVCECVWYVCGGLYMCVMSVYMCVNMV